MQGKENYADEKVYDDELNQIAQNANDGGGFRDNIQAAETITAFRPVFLDDTTNQWKYCDANDQARLQFDGFSLEAGSANTEMKAQTSNVVRGFSGLNAGKKYYVQDDGTIGTTPGTYDILVGIAISATELLIMKGSFEYMGSEANNDEDGTFNATAPAGAKFAIVSMTKQVPYGATPDGYIPVRGEIFLTKTGKVTGTVGGAATGGGTSNYYYISASWSGSTIAITESASFTTGTATRNITVYFYK